MMLAAAHDLYAEHIRLFPTDPDSYRIRADYATLLLYFDGFPIEDPRADYYYCTAAQLYTEASNLEPRGDQRAEAAARAVAGWQSCLDLPDAREATDALTKERQNRAAAKQMLTEQPLPDKQQKFLASFDTYQKNFPTAPPPALIHFHRAFVYYVYNHFDQAIQELTQLTNNPSSAESLLSGVNLLLDCYAIVLKQAKDRDKLRAYARALTAQLDQIERVAALIPGPILRRMTKQRAASVDATP